MPINLPNALTLSRIVTVPVIMAFLFLETDLGRWLAFSFYTYACVTDFLDGYLARAWRQQSSLGQFLDPIADKLLMAGVILMLVGVDQIDGFSILPAAVILCREILVSGLREFLAEVRVGVPVSRLAKWKTTLQMLALGFLIVDGAGPAFGPLSTSDVGVIGIWAAAALTLVTGYDYIRAGLKHMAPTKGPKRKAGAKPRPAKRAKPVREAG